MSDRQSTNKDRPKQIKYTTIFLHLLAFSVKDVTMSASDLRTVGSITVPDIDYTEYRLARNN